MYQNFGNTSNMTRKFYPITNVFKTIYSLKNLKRSKYVYLISNRPQVIKLVEDFRISMNQSKKDCLYISQLGSEYKFEKHFIYIDSIKIFSRIISLLRKKNLSNVSNNSYFEGVLLYIFFKIVFKIIKPTKAYFINWYDFYPGLIALNKNCKSIEIQHGIIHKYHHGYNFNLDDSKDLEIPDQFYLWDKFYFDKINLNKKIYYKIFERRIFDTRKTNVKHNNVVIIGQHTIREEINKYLLNNYTSFSSYENIIYRLHPKDISFKNKIIQDLSEIKNLIVTNPSDEKIEMYLEKSNFFIGVYSTLFIDIIDHGYNCGIMPINGFEISKQYQTRENVKLL